MGIPEEKRWELKLYKRWRKVIVWVSEDFYAKDDEEAIDFVESDDYDVQNYEWDDSPYYLEYNEDFEMTYPVTDELYRGGEIIWDNKPLEVKRQEKINELLDEK